LTRESVTTDAIVLRTVPYRDADLIVTLYTRERGKLSAMARSARQSKKRFGSCLQLFTVSEVQLTTRGGELHTLGSAQLERSYTDMAADMACFAHASYGTELVRDLSAPEVADPGMLELIVELYQELEERGASTLVLRAFELRILHMVGLAPVLERCVGCGAAEVYTRGVVLDPNRGGICCSTCAAMSRGAGVRPIAPGALRVLQAAQNVPSLAAASALAITSATKSDSRTIEANNQAEARDALVALLLGHIGKPLRSLEFIAKVSGAARHNREQS
jgi:DNA repair protein RecO (recombination protein O)